MIPFCFSGSYLCTRVYCSTANWKASCFHGCLRPQYRPKILRFFSSRMTTEKRGNIYVIFCHAFGANFFFIMDVYICCLRRRSMGSFKLVTLMTTEKAGINQLPFFLVAGSAMKRECTRRQTRLLFMTDGFGPRWIMVPGKRVDMNLLLYQYLKTVI